MGGRTVAAPGLLSQDEAEAVAKRVFEMVSGPDAAVFVSSSMRESARLRRGDMHRAGTGSGPEVSITLQGCTVSTPRIDDDGLRIAVAEAEKAAKEVRGPLDPLELRGPQEFPKGPKIFFESVTEAMESGALADVIRSALDATEAAGLIGGGRVHVNASSILRRNTAGGGSYVQRTMSEFSLRARTSDGTGSGWAWSGYEDWSRVDVDGVIARAVDLGRRSANPVAVEPGRYTVILEPPAVAALLGINWSAKQADEGSTVFSKDPIGTNKIGLQMLDERLGIVADPWDPEMPQSTVGRYGDPVDKVVWFDRGVLQDLEYTRWYAKVKQRAPVLAPWGIRLFGAGPTHTLDEMIASTRRGIWVNSLSGVQLMNNRTLLLTGTTRDGTFLIENGEITKAIKNFRFTESPFFVFNKLEAFGEPVRASREIVAPRLKVRDFDFTSLTDAV